MRPWNFLFGFFVALLPAINLATIVSYGAPRGGENPSCSFFVAPTGSDNHDGRSPDTAFATLEKARAAMRRGSSRVVCLRAGTYHITSTLTLTAADSGETWQYYAPDGVDTAVLDGGGTGVIGSNTGITTVIAIEGASNLTIDGLKIQNFDETAIFTPGGFGRINNITIENCDIGHDSYPSQWGVGAIWIGNATNTTIANNYVHDVHWDGIMMSAFNAGESIDGSVIKGNVVLNTGNNPASADAGGIYVSMRGTGTSGGHVTIQNNYVRDYGDSSAMQGRAIYLDDNSSNVTITGNVLAAPSTMLNSGNDLAAAAIFVHDGANNKITGNLIDLGATGNDSIIIWGYDSGSLQGMSGNTFTGNIIISGYTGTQFTNPDGNNGRQTSYFENAPGGTADVTIQNNMYFNYAGGQINTGGVPAGDSNPIIANPQISGWTYQLASNSPAYTSAVNFTPIVGGWGPAGFVIPQTGTAPSSSV